MADVEPADLRRLVADLAASGLSPASIRAYLRPLKAMFNTAVDDGALRASPAQRLRINKRHPEDHGEEQAKAMTHAARRVPGSSA